MEKHQVEGLFEELQMIRGFQAAAIELLRRIVELLEKPVLTRFAEDQKDQ